MGRGARGGLPKARALWLHGVVGPTVLLAPLVALTLVAVRGVNAELQHAWRLMPDVLSREIGRSLGTPVRIGSIAIKGRSVTFRDVFLADPGQPHSVAPLLHVRRATCAVPADLRSRLTSDGPLVDVVHVEGAVARVSRSSKGEWNLSSLFAGKPGAPGRRWVDSIEVEAARVEFLDAAMPKHQDRAGGLVRAVATGLRGELVFEQADLLRWSAAGRLSGTPVRTFGSYDGTRGLLTIGAKADRVAVPPWCARFLPRTVRYAGGVASGRVLVVAQVPGASQPATAGAEPVEWNVQGDLEGVQLRLPWVRDTVLVRAARVVASGDKVDAEGMCQVGRDSVRVRTAVSQFGNPRIDVLIAGDGLDLVHVARQAGLLGGAGFPADLRARGSGMVRLVGAPARLWVQGQVDASVHGEIVPGALTLRAGRARAWIGGPLASPTVRLAARDVAVRVKSLEVAIRDGRGLWDGQSLVFDGRGSAAGGTVEVTGRFGTGAGASPFRTVFRARGVSARSLLTELASEGAPDLHGVTNLDVMVGGDLHVGASRADYLVQVVAPKLHTFDADRLEVSGSVVGGLWAVDRAVLSRGRAIVTASGELSATRNAARLAVEVDGWPVSEVIEPWADASDVRASGRLYVRDGRIEGNLAQPQIRGTVYARGLSIGDFQTDYAVASLEGGPSGILLDGEAFRLPSAAVLHGVVRRPFSGAASATIGCTLSDIDLADIPGVADLAYDVNGSASAEGLLLITRDRIEVSRASAEANSIWIGDVPVGTLEAEASAANLSGPWVVHHASASVAGGVATAAGVWRPDGGFTAAGEVRDLSLSELGAASLRLGSVAGRVSGSVTVEGRPDSGRSPRLFGHASVAAGGLVVNGEHLGEASAQINVEGSRLTAGADGVLATIGGDGMRAAVTDASYDLETRELDATVRVDTLAVERVRRAVERTPLALTAGSWASRVAEALQPVSGPVDLEGRVRGVVDDLTVDATLKTGALAVADDLTLSADVRAVFDRRRAEVRNLELRSGDMVCSGSGKLTYGGELHGSLTADSVPVSLLARWASPTSPLRGLAGVVDTVAIEADGPQESPSVSAFAAARGITWRYGDPATTGSSTISLSAIRLSGATIANGRARVEDLAVAVSAPGQSPESAASLELHLSGTAPFSWQPPMLPSDAPIEVAVRCPPQALAPFVAGSAMQAEGQVQADLRLVGPSEQVVRLLTSDEGDMSGVHAGGTATLSASRLSLAGLSAYLSDVDLAIRLEDRLLFVGPAAAAGPIARVHSRRAPAGGRTSPPGDLHLSGAIALVAGETSPEPLVLTASGVRIDESPLPGMNSGRLVGELALPGTVKSATSGPATAPVGVRLVVTGSVATPKVAGELGVRNVNLRLPSDVVAPSRVGRLPVNPSFDVAMHALDHVFVSTTQMSAEVHTAANQPIRLAGSLAEPRLAGRLAVDGGALVFPTARFDIQKGGIVDVRYPGPGSAVSAEAGMDVSVDLAAVSRLSAVSVTGVPRRYTVTVEARGPILDSGAEAIGSPGSSSNRLRLTYRSTPPDLALSQSGLANRVTALLGGEDALQAVFGSRADAGQVLVGKFVDFVGGAIVPGLFDRAGLAESLGMDQLSVDYSRAGAFTLRLARQLGGPFEAEYWRRLAGGADNLGGWRAWEFRLGMRVKRGLRLTWSIDDQRTNAYLFEGVYSF